MTLVLISCCRCRGNIRSVDYLFEKARPICFVCYDRVRHGKKPIVTDLMVRRLLLSERKMQRHRDTRED